MNDTPDEIPGIRFRNQANQNSPFGITREFYINPHIGLLQNLISRNCVRLVIQGQYSEFRKAPLYSE